MTVFLPDVEVILPRCYSLSGISVGFRSQTDGVWGMIYAADDTQRHNKKEYYFFINATAVPTTLWKVRQMNQRLQKQSKLIIKS